MSEVSVESLAAQVEALTRQLADLQDRQAIRDVVVNYARSMDRLDRDLFLTTYHEDAVVDYGVFVGGRDAFYDWAAERASRDWYATHHLVGNHTVELDGDVAHAETYFIGSSLMKKGNPFTMYGGRYVDRLVKEDGKWSIACRVLLTDWALPAIPVDNGASEGVPLNQFSPKERALAESRTMGRRDRQDVSYSRPLDIEAGRRSLASEA